MRACPMSHPRPFGGVSITATFLFLMRSVMLCYERSGRRPAASTSSMTDLYDLVTLDSFPPSSDEGGCVRMCVRCVRARVCGLRVCV